MLNRTQAIEYGKANGPDLHALCQAASEVRNRHWGRVLTYSRKVFIPLTNMCRDTCGYCTFVKHPSSADANIMTMDEVLTTVVEGQKLGCKEALFSLGERPEKRYSFAKEALASLGYQSMLDYLYDAAEQVLQQTELLPHINGGTMTLDELRMLKPVAASMGMMVENTSMRLLRKGQAHHACPDKVPKLRLQTLKDAGKLDIAYTTGILIGIGETWEERVDSLMAINQIHQEYGHIQEVIIQNFRAKAGTAMANHPEPTREDMRRTLAVARLLLDPSISVQAPPNLETEYGSYISAGINDWGGISPLTQDFINPERAWPQIHSLTQACRGLDYDLQERLTIYPAYQNLSKASTRLYLDEALTNKISAMASTSGLAAHQWTL